MLQIYFFLPVFLFRPCEEIPEILRLEEINTNGKFSISQLKILLRHAPYITSVRFKYLPLQQWPPSQGTDRVAKIKRARIDSPKIRIHLYKRSLFIGFKKHPHHVAINLYFPTEYFKN